jgi:hypothetical protein
MMRPPPLLDLLGGRWSLGAAVTGIAWDGAVVGFGLADGSLALAGAQWDGAPALVPRPAVGLEVRPAERDPPPVARLALPHGTFVLRGASGGGFLCGGADGSVVLVAADGGSVADRHAGTAVDHVALGAAGRLAQARGNLLLVTGPDRVDIVLPAPVTGLAFDPAGERLAILHRLGVVLWPEEVPLEAPPAPTACAWNADGAGLAVGFADGALRAWRLPDGGGATSVASAPPFSLGFLGDGRRVVLAGDARPACWQPDARGSPPEPFGVGSRARSCIVACHPTRDLTAVGYDNGAVLLCQPASSEVLFLKDAGGGAVTALAWSTDGAGLALGTAEGELGAVALPAALFRMVREEVEA